MHIRQTIQTKYRGPGNVRGATVTARCDAGRITLGWDHALNPHQNHEAAARALMAKVGWSDAIQGGALHDGSMVWVLVEAEPEAARHRRMEAEGNTLRALRGLREASRGVLAAWDGGDLAGAVRALGRAVECSEIG